MQKVVIPRVVIPFNRAIDSFKRCVAVISLMMFILMLGCSPNNATASAATGQAIIQSTSASNRIDGVFNFQDSETGLVINGQFNVAPAGDHGFHIHEFGSCADGGNAAGGHYNPDGVSHGYLPDDGFENAHAGDLGNLTVTEYGTVVYNATLPGLSLTHGKYPIAGRAMILHENPDDFGQPVGNAGGRIGCGTIVLVAPSGSS